MSVERRDPTVSATAPTIREVNDDVLLLTAEPFAELNDAKLGVEVSHRSFGVAKRRNRRVDVTVLFQIQFHRVHTCKAFNR